MKKSEMIELMRKAYIETYHLSTWDAMEKVLETQEAAGMLPPERLSGYSDAGVFYQNIWEPEEEEK